MSTAIVVLPTNPITTPLFPTSVFTGLKIDVKRTDAFENIESIAASGRRTAVSWREMPESHFEIGFNFLDANGNLIPPSTDGTIQFTEYDTLRGFFNAQHGGLLPFLLSLSDLTRNPTDSYVTGQQVGTGDGTTVNFQLNRTVASFLEPLQTVDPNGTLNVYVDGTLKTYGSDYTVLTGGIVQFTSAPANTKVISADIPFLYLCTFDQDEADWDQISFLLHECQSLKLKTVIL